jgi:hypothetical protein
MLVRPGEVSGLGCCTLFSHGSGAPGGDLGNGTRPQKER